MAFILKRFVVGVHGYGNNHFYAKNKNQARMRAFRALQSTNSAITFKRFLQILSFIKPAESPAGFGQGILVQGKPAHWIENAGGNSIRFCWPDSDQILLSHELDVTFPKQEGEY